jgi:hypothetical protein
MAAPVPSASPPRNVHIFWDSNNILAGAENYAKAHNLPNYPHLRIDFRNMVDLVANGRQMGKSWLVGSVPPPTDAVWQRARDLGFDLEVAERTVSGKEGKLDETLREKMLQAHFDYPVGTVALLSGDGAGHLNQQGFFANLKRLHSFGWKIEVFSWDDQTNRQMRTWVKENGTYVALDEFYESITFLAEDRDRRVPARYAAPLPKLRRL